MEVDAVGISLVPEVIVAHQGGLRVLAFAIITMVANEKENEENEKDREMETDLENPKEVSLEVSPLRVQACSDLIGRLLYHMHHEL